MSRAKKAIPARFPEFQSAFVELMGDMTIQEFADKLGMSRATVGFYSAGKRIPDALGIRTIAEKCGVSADWLLGLSEYRKNENGEVLAKDLRLSEIAINTLKFHANSLYDTGLVKVLNYLIEQEAPPDIDYINTHTSKEAARELAEKAHVLSSIRDYVLTELNAEKIFFISGKGDVVVRDEEKSTWVFPLEYDNAMLPLNASIILEQALLSQIEDYVKKLRTAYRAK